MSQRICNITTRKDKVQSLIYHHQSLTCPLAWELACAIVSVYWYCNIVISGKILRSCAKNSSLYREYRYIEDRYIGVLSHTFYCNFCRDIAYLSLYRGYRYIEDLCIGVPLYYEQQINASTEIMIFGQNEEGLCLQVSNVFKKYFNFWFLTCIFKFYFMLIFRIPLIWPYLPVNWLVVFLIHIFTCGLRHFLGVRNLM